MKTSDNRLMVAAQCIRAGVAAGDLESLIGVAEELETAAKEPTNADRERAYRCVQTLLTAMRLAQRAGGADAKVHVGDTIQVIEAFQRGDMDTGAPITGPFYPRDVQ